MDTKIINEIVAKITASPDLLVAVQKFITKYESKKHRPVRIYKDKPLAWLYDEYARQMAETGCIDDTLHLELSRRKSALYDPVTRTMRAKKSTGRKTKKVTVKKNPQPAQKTVRKGRAARPARDLTTLSLISRYYKERKNGHVSDDTNEEMSRRMPIKYNAKKRELLGRCGLRKTVKKKVRLKKQNPNVQRVSKSISDDEAAYMAAAELERQTVARATKKIENTVPQNTEIPVRVMPTDNEGENMVFANNIKLMPHHKDTDVKLMADGTLLAVYGIVTDDATLPQQPIWRVYDTNLRLSRYDGYDTYLGKKVYIKKLVETQNEVHMTLSNGLLVLLDKARLKYHAAGRTFVMEKQK